MKIFGHEYTIVNNPETAAAGRFLGSCDNDHLCINVDPSLPNSEYDRTLLHEILEAIDCRLELNLSHAKISAISEMIGAILEENKMKTKSWRKIK